MQINNFDILLVSNSSWLARQIKWFSGSKWTHAGLFVILNEVIFIIEAQSKGIVLTQFSEYENSNKILALLQPKEKPKKDLTKILKTVGRKRYDYRNLLVLQPIKYLSKKIFNKELFLSKPNNKRFTCSEFVAYVYHEYFMNYSKVAPRDLIIDEFDFDYIT
jgi:hypothetical protein